MLTITSDAAEVIRAVLSSPEVPDAAGFRISTAPQSLNGSGPAIALELAPQPREGDAVLEEDGAQVFVAPGAAAALSDKLLDAEVEPDGEVRFALLEHD
jgi:iron-sulfur cluster assembly protein